MAETKIEIKLEEELKPLSKICEKLEETVKYELEKGIENVDAKEMGEVVDMIKDLYEAKEKMVKACYYKQIMKAMEKAEEEGDDGADETMDDGRRGYRGQMRDSRGRYMSRRGRRGYEDPIEMISEMDSMYPAEHYRDMDKMDGRMYYSGGGSSGGSSGGSYSGGNSGGSGGGMNSGGGGSRNYGGERYYNSEGGNYSFRNQQSGRSGESRRGYMETKEINKGNTPEEKQAKMKELEKYMKDLSEDVTEMISDSSPEEKTLLKQKLSVLMQKL